MVKVIPASQSSAQVAAAIAAAEASGARDFVETYGARDSSITAGTLAADTLYVGRVWPDDDMTLTTLMWCNGVTVNGNVEAVVFTYDGTTWTRVGTTGAVAQAGASAVQVVTDLSIPITRAVRTYLGLIPSSSTATFMRVVNAAATMNGADVSPSGLLSGLKASVGQPCPATVTGIAADIRTVWIAGAA